jgi:hypothetical protein
VPCGYTGAPASSAALPFCFALATIDSAPDTPLAPCGRRHPGPLDPRRVVADVLRMTAFQVGHPVSLFILVEGDDCTIQMATSWGVWPAAFVIDAWYRLLYMLQTSDFP